MTARDVIAQALALSAAAADGPWQPGYDAGPVVETNGGAVCHVTADPDEGPWPTTEFMAAARTLLPAFAKALGDVLDQLEGLADALAEHIRTHGPLIDAEAPEADVNRIANTIAAALSEVTP